MKSRNLPCDLHGMTSADKHDVFSVLERSDDSVFHLKGNHHGVQMDLCALPVYQRLVVIASFC